MAHITSKMELDRALSCEDSECRTIRFIDGDTGSHLKYNKDASMDCNFTRVALVGPHEHGHPSPYWMHLGICASARDQDQGRIWETLSAVSSTDEVRPGICFYEPIPFLYTYPLAC